MPLVSVIIPNYNHAAFLKERIDSVLKQTFTDFEIIILDDCSTDNSREVIENYRKAHLVSQISYNTTNSGSPFKQWQKGISLAKGEWIWIAESDDKADRYFLEKAFEILTKDPGIGCYYCDSYQINEKNEIVNKFSTGKNKMFKTNKWSVSHLTTGLAEINECLKFICTINNASAFLCRKEIFHNKYPDIAVYRYYGDWHFYINALRQHKIYYNNNAYSYCRIHSKSLANKKHPDFKSKTEFFSLLKFIISLPEVTDKKRLIKFYSYHYLGTGWIQDGIRKTMSLFFTFFKTDTRLAIKVISGVIWQKITRKNRLKLIPEIKSIE